MEVGGIFYIQNEVCPAFFALWIWGSTGNHHIIDSLTYLTKSRLGNLTRNHPSIGFLFKIQGEPVTNSWVRSFRMFWQRSWYVHFFTVSQPWHRPFCHRNKTSGQSIWCWTHSHDMSRGNKAGQDKGRNKTDQRDRYHLIDWSVKTWLGGKKDW